MRSAKCEMLAVIPIRNSKFVSAMLYSDLRNFAFRNSHFFMICHSCKSELKFEGPITRAEVCPSCDADVHCCLNCSNYDPSAHNRCREPQAEWVSDREKGNFCDLFLPNKAANAGIIKPADDIRRSFESLFKK